MYGSSELSQAFCRAAAVGGAIYMLCVGPASVERVEEGEGTDASPIFRLTTTDTEGATVVRCKNIITAPSYLSSLTTSPLPGALRAACARAVCVVRGAVISGAERCILTISPNTPPFNNPSPVFVWQLDSSSGACPTGYTVLYLSTLCVKAAAASAFEPVENDQSAEIGEASAALEAVVRQLTREMPSALSPEPDAAVAVTADDEDTRGALYVPL